MSHISVGLFETKRASRATRPPGGHSSIFCSDEPEAAPANSNVDKSSPQKPYRMASSFELGDEQPEQKDLPPRRKSRPSVNPVTGDLVGAFEHIELNGENGSYESNGTNGDVKSNGTNGTVESNGHTNGESNGHHEESSNGHVEVESSSETVSSSESVSKSSHVEEQEVVTESKVIETKEVQSSSTKKTRVPPGGFSTPLW